jgi:hypothetical protein
VVLDQLQDDAVVNHVNDEVSPPRRVKFRYAKRATIYWASLQLIAAIIWLR